MGTTKDNKKKALAIGLLALSAIGIVGFSVAYFTDILDLSGEGTMGSLRIEAASNPVHYWTGNDLASHPDGIPVEKDLNMKNINHGDRIVLSTTGLRNLGSKSAWIRTSLAIRAQFTLDGDTEVALQDYIEVYAGNVSYAEKDDLTPLALEVVQLGANPDDYASWYIVATPTGEACILNGEGDFPEKDSNEYTDCNAIGSALTIFVSDDLRNFAQGLPINFIQRVEAIQYRNNPDGFANVGTGAGQIILEKSYWVSTP